MTKSTFSAFWSENNTNKRIIKTRGRERRKKNTDNEKKKRTQKARNETKNRRRKNRQHMKQDSHTIAHEAYKP